MVRLNWKKILNLNAQLNACIIVNTECQIEKIVQKMCTTEQLKRYREK